MNYYIIQVTKFSQNCLIVYCKQTFNGAIIDPGGETKKIINFISKKKIILKKILITHGHIDHVGAAKKLSLYFSIKIFGPNIKDKLLLDNLPQQSDFFNMDYCLPFKPDVWLEHGNKIKIGNLLFNVIHCPGHTPGHIIFFEKNKRFLISGDTIFNNSIARTDLPQGDYKLLCKNIKEKILTLGDDVIFIPGHGAQSNIKFEKNNNFFIKNM